MASGSHFLKEKVAINPIEIDFVEDVLTLRIRWIWKFVRISNGYRELRHLNIFKDDFRLPFLFKQVALYPHRVTPRRTRPTAYNTLDFFNIQRL